MIGYCEDSIIQMEATSMDKKQLIKTIITVAPVFLVPLIVERKRIKDHPDVKSK